MGNRITDIEETGFFTRFLHLKHAFLTWFYQTPMVSRVALRGLNALLRLIEKSPILSDRISITSPRKNNITYLPISKKIDLGPKVSVNVGRRIQPPVNSILPSRVLDVFIERAGCHVLMDRCICRTAFDCKNFPGDVGCLFMGAAALTLPPEMGRRVTREKARRHVARAAAAGLTPLAGKVNVDNLGFLIPDVGRLMSVCFCCHCCCMMGYFKHSPDHLKKMFKPVEGLSIRVTNQCRGCGACMETCIFDAITIRRGRAVHGEHCVACGRCQQTCPHDAVKISLDNPAFIQAVTGRLESFIDLS
ncbi:MAG: hypothetical protein GY859_12795 [Desulfobacterales bacterium]|nr:hypothetical protein [Desulfobacterales bacterium]